MSKLSGQDVLKLVELFDDSDWRVMHLEVGDCELFLSKDKGRRLADFTSQGRTAERVDGAAQSNSAASIDTGQPPVLTPASPQAASDTMEGLHIVRAPSLGVFYCAPKPGADPYVKPGDRVTPESEVCLLEVMKLFTAVNAGITGTVSEILVSDGEMVEFDQPLFAIQAED